MKPLCFFVEGPDDERFVKSIFRGSEIRIIRYANLSKLEHKKLFNSVVLNQYYNYFYLVDSDGMKVNDRVKRILDKLPNCDPKRILVCEFEIESWYIAGLSYEDSARLKVKYFQTTDQVRKEIFEQLVPKFFTLQSFKVEILKSYNVDVAKSRNCSFHHFWTSTAP